MDTFFSDLLQLLLYHDTGNEMVDEFIFWSSFFMELVAAVGIVILLLRNENVRKRKSHMDRLIFWECILVLSQNVLDMLLIPLVMIEADWEISPCGIAHHHRYLAGHSAELLILRTAQIQ